MSSQPDPYDELAKHLKCSRDEAKQKFWEWFYGARLGVYQPGLTPLFKRTSEALVEAVKSSRRKR